MEMSVITGAIEKCWSRGRERARGALATFVPLFLEAKGQQAILRSFPQSQYGLIHAVPWGKGGLVRL